MAIFKQYDIKPLHPETPNNETGIQLKGTGRIVVDDSLGFEATFIKATSDGYVVWENEHTGELGVIFLDSNEMLLINYTKILSIAIVHGAVENTTAEFMYWGVANP